MSFVTPDFVNPLASPIALPTLWRLGLIYLAAVITVALINRGNLKSALGSNVGQRIIGWLIITPIYFIGVFSGRIPGLLVSLAFLVGAAWEYTRIAKLNRSFTLAMVVLAAISLWVADFAQGSFYTLPVLYFTVASALAIRCNDPKRSFEQASFLLYGCIWLIFGLCHLILLAKLGSSFDQSRGLIFLVIFAVAMADIGGYIVGKAFSRVRFLSRSFVADRLSPNKTYYGTLGYVLGAYLAIWVMSFAIGSYLNITQELAIGAVVGVFSFVGGLTHSYFKRYFGVKDSGRIIPGHGGIIDRVDSLARVSVVLYYFLLIFVK